MAYPEILDNSSTVMNKQEQANGEQAASLDTKVTLVPHEVVEPDVTCKEHQQNYWVDIFGWLFDLLQAMGWKIVTVDENHGRAGIHLMHNMFGSREPIQVPKEWVMNSWDWRESYDSLLANTISRACNDAMNKYSGGEESGQGRISDTVHRHALPDLPYPNFPGADQFVGSGGANFTVDLSYEWYIPEDSLAEVEIRLFNISGHYRDEYKWNHSDDPGQFSRQCRGWYQEFTLSSDWDEGERVERRAPVTLPPDSGP